MIDVETIGVGVDTKDVAKANRDLDSFGRTADKASRSADGTTKSMGDMASIAGRLAGVIGIAGLGGAAIRAADEFTKLNAQLKIASRNQAEFNASYNEVIRISNGAQTSINGTATLYARLANTLKDTNVTQQQFSQITESVALGLRVSGAGAQEAQSAMLQLSQAFASGVLRGEEFNSVSEASFPLMKALADSMGKPIEQLRTMAQEGKITRDELVKAFADQKLIDSFRSQSKEMNTVSGALTNVKNSLLVASGQFDKATGFSNFLASALNGVSIALDGITAAAKNVPFDSITRLLPAYAAYKKQLDSENKSLAIGGTQGSIIPRGLRMDEVARTDIGKLGEVSEEFKKIQSSYAEFAKTNPLNDAISKSKEYANSLQILADAESKGIISMQEAQRYRAQLRDEYEKSTKTTKSSANELIKQEETVRKYMFNLQQELDNEVTKRYNQAVKIREKDDKAEYERKKKIVDDLQKQANENYKESQREQEQLAKEVQKEYERVNETISRGLTDALMRGFESGKSFAENFRDTLKNMFQTLILKPVIEMAISRSGVAGLMGGIGSLFSGSASASSLVDGSLSGGGSVFNSTVGLAKDVFSAFNGGMTSAIESFGSKIASFGVDYFGQNSVLAKVGGTLGQYASTIGPVLGYAGLAVGAFNVVKSLFGSKDIPMTGDQARTSFNAGQISTKTNTFGKSSLGGKGALTQANEAFAKIYGSLLSQFDEDANFRLNTIYRSRTNKQGFFRFNGESMAVGEEKGISFKKFINDILGEGIAKVIQKSSAIPKAFRDLFAGLKKPEVVETLVNDLVRLQKSATELNQGLNVTTEQVALLAKESGISGENFTKLVDMVTSYSTELFTVGDALVKIKTEIDNTFKSLSTSALPTNLKAFDEAIKALDKTTSQGRQDFLGLISLREQFAQFEKGIADLKSGVRGALFGVVSESEQQAMRREDLAKMFADLNREVPASIQELIALGKSIDYTTAEGLNLALVFPALVDAFNQTEQGVKSLMGTLNASYFTTRADMLSANASDNPRAFVKGQAETNASLLAEIKQMKTDNADMKAIMAAVVEYTRQQQRIIDDWDVNGMPAERVA